MSRLTRLVRVLPLLFVLTACAEPPNKEMNQAQGAIDAARAAGAEQYAPAELTAALDALQQSEEAVAQRDYRLALGLAIDSRSRAQDAAKAAVEARSKARGDAERVVAEVSTLVARAREQLKDPDLAAVAARSLPEPLATITHAEQIMQEARAALAGNDYARTMTLTNGLAARVKAALAQIDEAGAASRARRRR